jgi:hypothetical protein
VRKWWTVVFWEWEEKVLNNGVSTSGEKVNSVEQWCCNIRRGKEKQLLDGVVSSMKDDEKMKKVVKLWWGKRCEFGVSVMEKKGGFLTVVFQQ